MNATEQKERSTVVHQLEKRLEQKFEAVIGAFDEELERLAKQRVADLMTIAGIEAQLVDIDARVLDKGHICDDRWLAINETTSKLLRRQVMFEMRTFRQRMNWIFRGR